MSCNNPRAARISLKQVLPWRRHVIVLSALVLLAGHAAGQEHDWPGFRGPHRDGVARSAKPPLEWSPEENLKWKVTLPGPGSSSPIVVGDRVYVACYSGYGAHLDDGGDRKALNHHLVCFDRDKGKLLWNLVVPGPLEKDARQIQLNEHGFASPTPVSDGKVIYAYFGRAGLVAVDHAGAMVWKADLGKPSEDSPPATNSVEREGKVLPLRWGAAASPLIHEDLVIVNASEESNSIRAFDRRSGKLMWKRESANLEGSAISPILAGPPEARVLVIVLAGDVWGLDPGSGEPLWQVETGSRGGMCPTPVADSRHVYTFGGSGQSHALRYARQAGSQEKGQESTSRVAWSGENLGVPSPVLHEGLLFLVRTRGIALCLKAGSGEVVFNERLKGRTGSLYASPVLANGRLYVVSRKRGTFVYSADGKFELLARNELKDDSQFNASPAVSGNELYLRSDKFLYCLAGS